MSADAPLWLPPAVWAEVEALATRLTARGWRLATAESCTGGLVAAACTARAGSSDWFERGWVTYANTAKVAELGVPAALIEAHGAVSEPVARAMAAGAAARAGVAAALAVTGIAGPGGGSAAKPVGTVWFAWCVGGQVQAERVRFDGERAAVRAQAVLHALAGLRRRLPG
ncbi:Nicotinamide-nucleotide amidohydrolase PncC [Tepidimonas sediminis]|uniref:Nicotinamide-nucleotide amidohydrolase PncC n=1 Tax=Tepidimonas sediminis TaxID=2588941 RepID=A0A554WLC2_9BURK|nr:CinA family protein [Tepidimonas sediminis]TSE24364.1 Nicotinamide-nucleotide amidohydrolase PncC [Tepidimonas sediminis]